MTIKDKIAEMEKSLREAGATVEALCDAAGIARSTWQRWKSGDTAPNMQTWDKISTAHYSLVSGV